MVDNYLDNYRILYAYFVNSQNTEYKAPWNQLVNRDNPGRRAYETQSSYVPELGDTCARFDARASCSGCGSWRETRP
jgi:hypothetical protein